MITPFSLTLLLPCTKQLKEASLAQLKNDEDDKFSTN